ncbi:hypothetical protein M422DRAFT_85431, partial [Sphaerobolus stellatus SS14]
QKLVKLRSVVLEYLKDLEHRLAQVETPLKELWEEKIGLISSGTPTTTNDGSTPSSISRFTRPRSGSFSASAIAEARTRIRVGLEMLNRLRADVSSHLPDLQGLQLPRAADFLPDMPTLPHLSDLTDLDFTHLDVDPPSITHAYDYTYDSLQVYLPVLNTRLDSLHEHLRSVQLPSSVASSVAHGMIGELLQRWQDPDLLTDPLKGPFYSSGPQKGKGKGKDIEGVQEGEKVNLSEDEQIRLALEKSANGAKLISYNDLPQRYRNNDFVDTGYRFIPLHRWPRILSSIFQVHNETANIWTHLLPLVYSLTALVSTTVPMLESHKMPIDIAECVFTLFANICLASSCIWHIMSGCAHMGTCESAARIDYVGIGWLITASIGSVLYYGFSCRPMIAAIYLSVSFCLGVAASILPFMSWFNDRENKIYRICFFLSLIFTMIGPCAHLVMIHSFWDMYTFISAELASVAAYAVGLLFYALRFPECAIPPKWTWVSDWFGGGSHAIWHLFIVL